MKGFHYLEHYTIHKVIRRPLPYGTGRVTRVMVMEGATCLVA